MAKFVEGFAGKLEVPAGAKDVQAFDAELPGFGIRKFATVPSRSCARIFEAPRCMAFKLPFRTRPSVLRRCCVPTLYLTK